MAMSMAYQSCICFFNSAIPWGGGEKWHFEAASYFHQKGYKVLIVAQPNSELAKKAIKADIPTHTITIGNLSFINPIKLIQLRQLFKQHRVEHIFLNLSADLKAAGIAAKLAGIKQIVYRRGLASKIKGSVLNQWLLTHVATDLIANSVATQKQSFSAFPQLIQSPKMHVIYNGINFEKYQQTQPLPNSDDHHQLIIGNIGRLSPEKGQQYLIALAEALLQNDYDHFQIHIAGTGTLQHELEALIQEKKLENHVKLVGFQDPVGNFLQQIDIFVLSSISEGFGYVMVEAGLYKKPVIAFDTASTPEIIMNGKSGFLVPLADINAMAEKVKYLADHSDARIAMGEAGYKYITQKFAYDQSMQALESLLTTDRVG